LAALELAAAAGVAERELAEAAPYLVERFRAALPAAADDVGRRLRGALHREGLRPDPAGTAHAFGRVEHRDAPADPARLLDGLDHPGLAGLATEVTDATVNLAVAYARRSGIDARVLARADVLDAVDTLDCAASLTADEQTVFFERLATEGHNLHPCGRTRLGWRVADLLAHDVETLTTTVHLAAVRQDAHRGDDLGELLRAAYPDVPAAPPGYRVQPVHAWQLGHLTRHRPELAGRLRMLDAAPLPAVPTSALRTLLLPPDRTGARHYVKVSLDIQVTSSRRTISVASTRNGPVISALLHRVQDDDRVLLLAEVAGAALDAGPGADRDAAAILRAGLGDRLAPGEIAVPGAALPARSPLTGRAVVAEVVDAYTRTTGRTALSFVDEYAALLLPPVLRLATRYGIGLEAHLQNCLPTFVAGVPHRIAFRDFAGLRLHVPRLRARGLLPELWPGSVVATGSVDVLLAKVCYTALQAHLGELVVQLVGSHGLDEPAAWRLVRARVDEAYDDLRADPAIAAAARADHAFLTAPTVPHKALVRMRLLPGTGDIYVPVKNAL
jgi:siderophore synthetase component